MLKGEHKIIKCDCKMEERGGIKVHLYRCAIRRSRGDRKCKPNKK